MNNPTKELTYEERATWGVCPACKAEHGEPCDPNIGLVLGRNVIGQIPDHGVHLGRLQNAPKIVELRPIG